MPLNTNIVRDGEDLKLRWGYWHLNVMYTAAILEQDPEWGGVEGIEHISELGTWELAPLLKEDSELGWEMEEKHAGEFQKTVNFDNVCIYYIEADCDLVNKGRQELTQTHRFLDPTDGEILELKPGDVLSAYRSHKS